MLSIFYDNHIFRTSFLSCDNLIDNLKEKLKRFIKNWKKNISKTLALVDLFYPQLKKKLFVDPHSSDFTENMKKVQFHADDTCKTLDMLLHEKKLESSHSSCLDLTHVGSVAKRRSN